MASSSWGLRSYTLWKRWERMIRNLSVGSSKISASNCSASSVLPAVLSAIADSIASVGMLPQVTQPRPEKAVLKRSGKVRTPALSTTSARALAASAKGPTDGRIPRLAMRRAASAACIISAAVGLSEIFLPMTDRSSRFASATVLSERRGARQPPWGPASASALPRSVSVVRSAERMSFASRTFTSAAK